MKNKCTSSFVNFITQPIDSEATPVLKKIIILILRFVYYLYSHFFIQDGCLIRASALTYVSLLSIVPILAVMFSLIKGLGFETKIAHSILSRIIPGQTGTAQQILEYINNINAGRLGAVGASILVLSVIIVMGNIEKSFNQIWKVKASRTLFRKLTDYIGILVVTPIFIILSMSLSAFFTFSKTVNVFGLQGNLAQIHMFVWPYLTVWCGFLFVNLFMPNTRVKIIPALIGSLVAAILWQYAQTSYLHYQAIAIKNYKVIYGGLGQLPILLLWIYISWIILLLGAEITYIAQHFRFFNQNLIYKEYSGMDSFKIALVTLAYMTRSFKAGSAEVHTLTGLKDTFNIPENVLSDILERLITADIIVKRINDEGEEEFFLKTAPETIDYRTVFHAMLKFSDSHDYIPDVRSILAALEYQPTLEKIEALLHKKNLAQLS